MFFNKNENEENQYHGTIRNLVVAVGSLFHRIILVRKNRKTGEIEEKLVVPIMFSNRDKMLSLYLQGPNIEEKNTNFTLPRIGFAFQGLSFDPQRMKPNTGGMIRSNEVRGKDSYLMYNPVPYNFSFSVSILTKYAEDLTQIVEKILPYFTPHLNITYRAIPELDLVVDVPIILESVNWQDEYEGLSERRVLGADLELNVKGWIFPPLKNAPVVHQVDVETHLIKDKISWNRNVPIDIEKGLGVRKEDSGKVLNEVSGLDGQNTEHSLIRIYGNPENDHFGFKEYLYEMDEYDEPKEREAILNRKGI